LANRGASTNGKTSNRFLVGYPPASVGFTERLESGNRIQNRARRALIPVLRHMTCGSSFKDSLPHPLARMKTWHVTGNGYYFVTVNDVKRFFEFS